MGATKAMAIEIAEQEVNEVKHISEVIEEAELSPRDLIIQGLINRDLPMSYSKLKHLDSPVNFINNLLKPKEKNASMTFGSLVDCLVLEEHKFEKCFDIVSDEPTTDTQKAFVKNFCEKTNPLDTFEERVEEAFSQSYKRGSSSSLEHLFTYLKALESGKEVVSKEVYEKALKIADNLKRSDEVLFELEQCEEFQKFIEFELGGWQFRGILDTYAPTLFHDMKFTSDCNPDNFARSIEKYGYDIQFGLYSIGLEILGLAENPKFKYILFDDKFNYSIAEVGEDYLYYGRRKVEHYLKRLDKMVDDRGFYKSFDYFKSKNIIHKPRWITGFDETLFENE
ncbi:PD-(D/E)XK nuclease-like domain-containing protein [Riemerella anatipestifer]